MASPRRSALLLAHVRDRGVLTAARALADAGWRVDAGVPGRDGGLLGASRSVTRVHSVPRPRGRPDRLVEAVTRAHEQVGYDLVFGSGDDWLVAVAHLADRLPMQTAHPSADVVDRALDKVNLTELAASVGLGHLRTEQVDGEVGPELAGWGLPVVVKNRTHWRPGQVRPYRVETRVCRTPEQAADQVARLRAGGDVPVLQSYVRGGLTALIGVMHDGRLLGRVQQRAERLWPTPSGASSRAVTVPVDPGLAGRSEELLRRLGWTGLVELQFMVGPDGVHRLIDLNGRFFGSLSLSETARPGLVAAWADAATGEAVVPLPDGAAGIRYQWLAGDLRRARRERRGGLLRDVVSSLGYGVGARHSISRLVDPGPALHLLTGRVRERLVKPERDGGVPAAASVPAATARHAEMELEHALATPATPTVGPVAGLGDAVWDNAQADRAHAGSRFCA